MARGKDSGHKHFCCTKVVTIAVLSLILQPSYSFSPSPKFLPETRVTVQTLDNVISHNCAESACLRKNNLLLESPNSENGTGYESRRKSLSRLIAVGGTLLGLWTNHPIRADVANAAIAVGAEVSTEASIRTKATATASTPPPSLSTSSSPSPTVKATTKSPASASSKPILENPGDTKNCSDFATYKEAKEWFDKYYNMYGDVAQLDKNKNLIPCESLPGAPSLAKGK